MSLSPKSFRFFLVLLACACAKQGEGERCLRSNGDRDCDDGLVCWPADDLADSAKHLETAADRCCPEDGESDDPRCAVRTVFEDEGMAGTPETGGDSSNAGSAGVGTSGSAGSSGSSGGAD